MAIINFDARAVAPDEGRTGPVPAAWYNFAATELKLEPTSAGTGMKLTGVFQILDGAHKGRKVYHNFNMQNPSEKAQEIGHKQFSALCHACRTLVVQDTNQLLNIPFKARVKVTPGDGQYEAKNEITAFKDINDVAATAAMAAAQAAPAALHLAPPAAAPAAPAAPAPAAPAAAQQWQAPAAQQPWQAPAVQQAPNAQPVQQAPVQQAPVQQQPWQAPNAQPAPAAAAPAPQPTIAQQPAAVTAQADGQTLPPWMQPAQ